MPSRPYPAWQTRHDAVLLHLMRHPTDKLYEVARATGYSPDHLGRIIKSPEFKRRYAAEVAKALREAGEALSRSSPRHLGAARRRAAI